MRFWGDCWEWYTEFGCCASGQSLVFYWGLMPLPVGSPMKGRSWCYAGFTFCFGFLFGPPEAGREDLQ